MKKRPAPDHRSANFGWRKYGSPSNTRIIVSQSLTTLGGRSISEAEVAARHIPGREQEQSTIHCALFGISRFVVSEDGMLTGIYTKSILRLQFFLVRCGGHISFRSFAVSTEKLSCEARA